MSSTLQMAITYRSVNNDSLNDDNGFHHHEYDEEIEETEDDLIENYYYLAQHCGVLRQSPTKNILNLIQEQQQKQMKRFSILRRCSSANENENDNDYEHTLASDRQRHSPSNDLHDINHDYSRTDNHIPPVNHNDAAQDDIISDKQSSSLIRLFARMKAHFKHDRAYRPKPEHEVLLEKEIPAWHELTKNIRVVLREALLPDGEHSTSANHSRTTSYHQKFCKESYDYDPILSKKHNDDNDISKVDIEIDDELNAKSNEQLDQTIWNQFLTCSRGFNYRRGGICKAVDRQQFQGQLVYFYNIANNILIDENLRASGLG